MVCKRTGIKKKKLDVKKAIAKLLKKKFIRKSNLE